MKLTTGPFRLLVLAEPPPPNATRNGQTLDALDPTPSVLGA